MPVGTVEIADDNLFNNEVYYSSFLSDDIARSAVSASASLVSSLDYFSLPVPTNKNNKLSILPYPWRFYLIHHLQTCWG